MLIPRRTKHRKQHHPGRSGLAKGGTELAFGEFGLQALEFFLVSFLIELGRGGFGFLAHAFNFSPLSAKIGNKSRAIMHKHSN